MSEFTLEAVVIVVCVNNLMFSETDDNKILIVLCMGTRVLFDFLIRKSVRLC